MQEVGNLDHSVRGGEGFCSTILNNAEENPLTISILERVQFKPDVKGTTQARNVRQLICVKQMQKWMNKKEQVFCVL